MTRQVVPAVGEPADQPADRLRVVRRRLVAAPGTGPDDDLVDVGQQPRSRLPLGRDEQRDVRRAGGHGSHRGAGEQDIAEAVQPGDQRAGHRDPRIRSTAAPRSGASRVAALASSRRVTGVGTSQPCAPAAAAAVTSEPMSPTTATCSGADPERGGAVHHEAGLGLAAAAPVRRRVRADLPGVERAEQPIHLRVHRIHLRGRGQPPADGRLVRDDADGQAGAAQPVERLGRAGHRTHQRRVVVVRHVVHEGAVAVEQHGPHPAAPRPRGAPAPPPAQPVVDRREGDGDRGESHRADLGPGPRTRPDAAERELPGEGRPRAGEQKHGAAPAADAAPRPRRGRPRPSPGARAADRAGNRPRPPSAARAGCA